MSLLPGTQPHPGQESMGPGIVHVVVVAVDGIVVDADDNEG